MPGPNGFQAPKSLHVADLNEFFGALVAKKVQEHFPEPTALIELRGYLGPFKAWKGLYYVPLFESLEQQDAVTVRFRREQLENRFQAGDYVAVIGTIVTQSRAATGTIELRLHCSRVARAQYSGEAFEPTQPDSPLVALFKLKDLRIERHVFPACTPLNVSVIYPESLESSVLADFQEEVLKLGDQVIVNPIPTAIEDSDKIAAAVERVQADVLVLIRGGGEDLRLGAFDHPAVFGAIARSRTYRIAGLGHTRDTTVSDLVCDYVAQTPSFAAVHITSTVLERCRTEQRRQALSDERDAFLAEKRLAERRVQRLEAQKEQGEARVVRTESRVAELQGAVTQLQMRAGTAERQLHVWKKVSIWAGVIACTSGNCAVPGYSRPAPLIGFGSQAML
jgi:exonuclease VII large subunit